MHSLEVVKKEKDVRTIYEHNNSRFDLIFLRWHLVNWKKEYRLRTINWVNRAARRRRRPVLSMADPPKAATPLTSGSGLER